MTAYINLPKRKPKPKPKSKVKSDKMQQVAKLYNKSNWVKLRNAYYQAHPLCELCLDPNFINEDGTKGETITPTDEIHHKVSISKGANELEMMDYAYNPSNLIALCRYHHHYIHRHNIQL